MDQPGRRAGLILDRSRHAQGTMAQLTAQPGRSVGAFWRDLRFLQALAQAIFVVLVLLAARWLIGNLLEALDVLGVDLSFGFLQRTAGFEIAEGPAFERSDTYLRAYVVGVANSVRVVGIGLALTSLLGLLAGVALLSPNWLLRNIVHGYVEVMRNTPLLLQLFFLYSGVILKLPSLENRITLGPVSLSQRGFYMPSPLPQPGFDVWLVLTLVGMVIAAFLYVYLFRRRQRTGVETRPTLWAALPLLGFPLLGWILAPRDPILWEVPRLEGLRIVGGTRLTPEFAAILLGLVLYTAAFIADIVRSGIQAVSKGQREAARSLGLTEGQVLRFVILPQALRVIIPPLTNQYLNLAKNSSLAIGVGYADLYSVSQTMFNQSGQAVQVIALMMGTYLAMSLIISAVMNFFNARLRIVER